MTVAQRFTIIFLITILSTVESSAQKVKMLGHVVYGNVNYRYNEHDYLYQIIKTSSIPSYGIKTSVQLALSENFRIGSGLNYIITKGTSNPVFVDKGLSNSNTTGNFTLAVNSSCLQIPLEFIVRLSHKWKIKPFITGGLNLYVPLKQYYFAKISPTNPNTFYVRVENTINKGTEYHGAFIGSGMAIPINEKRDFEIRLIYGGNSFSYKSPLLGTGIVSESRFLKFNTLELSLGVGLF